MSIVTINHQVLQSAKVAELLNVEGNKLNNRIHGLIAHLRHNGDDVNEFFVNLGSKGVGVTRIGFYVLANQMLDTKRIVELANLYSNFEKEINTEIHI